MSYNFFIVGGDKRNLLLAEKLSKNEENVKLFGFNRINDSYFANNNITKIKNLHELNNELNNPNTPNTPNNRTIFANLNVYAKDEKLSEQIKDEKLSKQIKATNSNVHKKESKLNKQISDTQIIIGAIPLTIDGKTIYRKVYKITSGLPRVDTASTLNIADLSIERCLNLRGWIYNTTFGFVNLNFYNNGLYNFMYLTGNTTISYQYHWLPTELYIILEYTKTS